MSFLMQHVELLVLVVLGLMIGVGFLHQYTVVQGRGLIALGAGIAALFGWSLFQNARKRRIREEIAAKRAALEEQAEALEAFQERYAQSREQLRAQQEALADQRRLYLKRLAEIEAANEAELRERLTEIEHASPGELADRLTDFAAQGDTP